MDFARNRYYYLGELMKQIDKIVLEYKRDYQKIVIEQKTEMSERILLLIEENKKRLDF